MLLTLLTLAHLPAAFISPEQLDLGWMAPKQPTNTNIQALDSNNSAQGSALMGEASMESIEAPSVQSLDGGGKFVTWKALDVHSLNSTMTGALSNPHTQYEYLLNT